VLEVDSKEQYLEKWRDYYDILEIDAGCNDERLIRQQRNDLIIKVHPDRTPGVNDKYAKEINLAYECLIDPERRARYWRYYQENHPNYRKRSGESESWYRDKAAEAELRREEAVRKAAEAEIRQKHEEQARREAQIKEKEARERAAVAEIRQKHEEQARREAQIKEKEARERAAVAEIRLMESANKRRGKKKKSFSSGIRFGRIVKPVKEALRYALFAPLSIVFKIVSFATVFIGSISAIGIPYGLYSGYRVFIQLRNGVSFAEATHKWFVGLFVILPVIAFLIHFLVDKLIDYFEYRLP